MKKKDGIGNIFTEKGDMGSIIIPGMTMYDWKHQKYTLSGSGKDIWSKEDEFHFAFKHISGDFIITCTIEFSEKKGHMHQKAGLMLRASLKESAVYADAVLHGNGVSSLQYRPIEGEKTEDINSSNQKPHVLQLERSGNTVIVRRAVRGSFLEEAGRIDLELSEKVYAGLFVCSHDQKEKTSATFHNLRIDIPAAPGTDGYKNPPRSRMETVDVDSGERKVLFATDENIEAPNWSPDGKYLLYNKKGQIYRYDFERDSISQINTGLVSKNNNDHGISPDGKSLIMSSHHGKDGKSRIYICPIGGGEGRLITPEGPSYWYGISPDGKTLTYCAEREGEYNIWCIPFEGGEEYQLTKGDFLDDGPEFSREGGEIFFNSTRTGKMKIWKMKMDGTEQQQVTAGETNDWFAHISPNGKKMVYLSYPKELQADSHPHNQRVLIQLFDLEGGETQVLAYLYGGQGTLNVPSWSPDSKYIAFVSYTYGDPGE